MDINGNRCVICPTGAAITQFRKVEVKRREDRIITLLWSLMWWRFKERKRRSSCSSWSLSHCVPVDFFSHKIITHKNCLAWAVPPVACVLLTPMTSLLVCKHRRSACCQRGFFNIADQLTRVTAGSRVCQQQILTVSKTCMHIVDTLFSLMFTVHAETQSQWWWYLWWDLQITHGCL